MMEAQGLQNSSLIMQRKQKYGRETPIAISREDVASRRDSFIDFDRRFCIVREVSLARLVSEMIA